ncbi:hypothetical protein B0G81_2094 [Paraburkholderia sp. BL6665CI2N2]|nr:hypothetical protein [Paraburkholderia sp. BL6665CI2N2]TDY21857.1 hypothetical protein B0G81_2094 [Paraburkholderia sp. BL6665CI2N2]
MDQFPRTVNPAGLAKPGGHYRHVSIAQDLIFVSGRVGDAEPARTAAPLPALHFGRKIEI